MGLKIDNYKVVNFGITVPTAYARITNLNVDTVGNAYYSLEVYQNRNDIFQREPLEVHHFSCRIDKNQPLYTQLYDEAKSFVFKNWEDDIVEDDPLYHEEEIHPEFMFENQEIDE